MLRLGLTLLLATSAFAAPSVSVDFYSTNEVGYTRNDGSNSYLIKRSFETIDGGDLNFYIVNAQSILSDLVNVGDRASQASALGQAIAVLGEVTYGIPGDACASGSYIESFANGVQAGNLANVRPALANFMRTISLGIDSIVKYLANPSASRYTIGPRAGCQGDGRSYRYDVAWNAAINASNVNNNGLVNEGYCLARRMYDSFNGRNNNVGALLTAANIPVSTQVFEQSYDALYNFLNAVASGGNVAQAGARAKQALSQAVSRVQL